MIVIPDTKFCPKCKLVILSDGFPRHKNRSDGLSSWCKKCTKPISQRHYEANKESIIKKTIHNRKKRIANGSTSERDWGRAYRRNKRGSVEYEMSRRLTDIKKRCRKHNRICSISAMDLVQVWHHQAGKCALSGISMTLGKGLVITAPNTASVDRIDSNKGYTKDNVRLTTWIANRSKAAWSDKDFLNMCIGVFRTNNLTI